MALSERLLASWRAWQLTAALGRWKTTAIRRLVRSPVGTGSSLYRRRRVRELGIPRRDLLRISPPGSSHLRGLALTDSAMTRLGQNDQPTWLLWPSSNPAEATLRYIELGLYATGVDQAYKCRVRKPWWRVPVLAAPDIFLTCMNADTARLTTNSAGAQGVISTASMACISTMSFGELGREALPVASLNSMTLLSAGRDCGALLWRGYLENRAAEADRWWMPSPATLTKHRAQLADVKPRVQRHLQNKNLLAAVALVDEILFSNVLSTSRAGRAANRSPSAHLPQDRSWNGCGGGRGQTIGD